MKKIKILVVLCLVIFLNLPSMGQGISFEEGNLESVLSRAKRENKIVFIDFMASWCGPCKIMSQKVFTNATIGELFNKKFINCKIDGDKNKDLSDKYGIKGFPTLLWLSPEGKEIRRIIGATSQDNLYKVAKEICGERKNLSELYKSYKKEELSPKEVESMLLDIKYFLSNVPKDNREMWISRFFSIYNDYVKTNGKEILLSQNGFYLINFYENDLSKESDVLKFMLKHTDKYKTLLENPINLSYFRVNRENNYIEHLAKNGQVEHKKQLERIKGDLSEAYQEAYKSSRYVGIDLYNLLKMRADAFYYLYSKKDESMYIELKQKYFDTLKDLIIKNDYSEAIDNLFAYNNGKLARSSYKSCILWIKDALKLKDLKDSDIAHYNINMGECYQGLKDKVKAKECYTEASIMAVRAGDKRLQMIAREFSKKL